MNFKSCKTSCCLAFILTFFIFTISNVKAGNDNFSETSPLVRSAEFQANSPTRDMTFGSRIAIDGNTAVIGAVNENNLTGAIYVFIRSGKTWTQQARLQANDIAVGDAFGFDVGISGDTIVTSSYRKSGGGAVYVFVRSGTTWTQQQKILSSDLASGDLFGWKLGISGNTIIASSPDKNVNENNLHGSAYIFTRSGTVWTEQQILNRPTETNTYRLGRSVAIDGDTVVIGAPETFDPSLGSIGAAYVYTRSGTTWTEQQRLYSSDTVGGEDYARSAVISGNTVVIGAPKHTVNGNLRQGAAYVFVRSGTTWTQEQKITNPNGRADDALGGTLAIDGNTLILSRFSPLSTVYVLTRSGTTWTERRKLTYSDSGADPYNNNSYASHIAVDGDTIMVGAVTTKNINGVPFGSVFVYTPSTNKVYDFDGDGKSDVSVYRPSNGVWYLNQSQNGFGAFQFGNSTDKIAPADFDGDGRTDAAVFRDGFWYYLRSSNNTVNILQFGSTGDLPIPGDFDGDETADISVFRPSNAIWYRLNSSTGAFVAIPYGLSGDKPLLANFDGDMKSDLAVYRPTTGQFYWMESTTGTNVVAPFGTSTDIPVMGDYDGDGKTDITVFRPSNGAWYRLNSSNGEVVIYQFGTSGDIPAPADFDGDGKTDSAVFRPSNGFWYVREPVNGTFYGYNFGLINDRPIPAAFLN